MISLTDLLAVALFVVVCLFWWAAQGAKQRARAAVKKYCEQWQVQLLDDAVALRGLWWKRDERGNLRLWRSYNFEFTSTGNERYTGRIVLLGTRVENIELEPHRIH